MSEMFSGHKLLLIGRTGNGKSATGNSILGIKEFQSRGASSAIVYDVRIGKGTIEGVPIAVVDGPGLGDTSTDVTETGHSMNALVKAALALIDNQFHALVVVLKYGARLTTQETEVIRVAKMVFGADIFTRYGIVVMTHGDLFEKDAEDEAVTFEDWCDRQVGEAAALFDECGRRCVLFNNVTNDDDKKRKQTQKLMAMVESIKRSGPPYSEEDFQKADHGRQKLVVMGKMPKLVSETESVLARISRRLDELGQVKQNESTDEVQNTICEIQKISGKLQDHKVWLHAEDDDTKLVDHLFLQISLIESRVRTMIALRSRKLEMALLSIQVAQEFTEKQQGRIEFTEKQQGSLEFSEKQQDSREFTEKQQDSREFTEKQQDRIESLAKQLDTAKLEDKIMYIVNVFFLNLLMLPVIAAFVNQK